MNPGNNEPRRGLDGGGRKSNAVVADTTVPHGSDKRQTKGARQCVPPETDETAAVRDYWAAAKRRYKRGDYADYGSPDWCALPIEDPRKLAGIVAFAEMWRKYGNEIADDLNRQLAAPRELVRYATRESCETAWQQLLAKQQRIRKEAA